MLPKAYEPQGTEDRIYKMWEESGVFRANAESVNSKKKESFSISMPPPNATGQLHLGHAVMLALQDIFARFQRMQGKEVLWLPGTDHAAIATENVVIRKLKSEGMADPRKTLGREKLVAKIAEFVDQSRGTIRSQVRKMGSSCDWSRERYTFDPSLNRCVNEVFRLMYDDGLIYRGHRIVNWDPKLQTTVSDDEVTWVEETTPFYTFQYGPFQIATARPETKFGDKYVVMHPDDKRYAKYKHGQTFDCEWINGPVRATIIKDTAVDPEFGTGVMTITPWHDAVDFEIAERHKLEKEQVIDFSGRLLAIAGEFTGMKIEEARPLIVEKLNSKGLLVKTEAAYVHNKATNSRGGGSIEPQIKLQWFIDVKKPVILWGKKKRSIKEILRSVVESKEIAIIPERFEKTYFHWIDNLRDWCISRQIWWGHRVPVWYSGEKLHVGTLPENNHSEVWEQDPDTLDTWFSSALWTWSTLIDPKLTEDPKLSLVEMLKQSPDFQAFHPTSVMETGYDILFFWVARMILMTTYVGSNFSEKDLSATDRVPFRTVYLHGLVRTRDGRKMSKSDPETMIDPLDMISRFGADALRLSMIVGQSPGNDMRLYSEKIEGYRNFINKLWNAARFILLQCEQVKLDPAVVSDDVAPKSLADKALLCELQAVVRDITSSLKEYRLSEVGERMYSFVWDYFCDWYIELSKGEPNPSFAVHCFRTILTLLHPYCPFVTEELWSSFKSTDDGSLISESWPNEEKTSVELSDAHDDLQVLIDVIKAIRKLRVDQGIEPGKPVEVTLCSSAHHKLFSDMGEHIKRMARVSSLGIENSSKKPGECVSTFLTDVEVHLSLEGLLDPEKEKQVLSSELENLTKYVANIEGRLQNPQFASKAPAAIVEAERAKVTEAKGKIAKIAARLKEVK